MTVLVPLLTILAGFIVVGLMVAGRALDMLDGE